MSDKKSSDTESHAENVVSRNPASSYGGSTWGPWLFNGAFAVSMLFMWWLVIYDHGVVSHH